MTTINSALERVDTDRTVLEQQMDRPRQSGFVLQSIDAEAAREALRWMAENADPVECQETLDYLMKALNETRSEGGERELFV